MGQRLFRKLLLHYPFFAPLFAIIWVLHVLHIILIEQGSWDLRILFISYATLQIAVLAMIWFLLFQWLEKWKLLRYVSLLIFLIFFVVELLEFPLVRIMDMTVWYVVGFMADETLHNFLELLYASHVPLIKWVIGTGVFLSLILGGVCLYKLSTRILRRYPLWIRRSTFSVILSFSLLLVGTNRFLIHKGEFPHTLLPLYEQALVWKENRFDLEQPTIQLVGNLKPPPSEQWIVDQVANRFEPLETRPDVFIFIIESLREDYLNEEIAPHLAKFKGENISTPLSFAATNATGSSWFSIFFSQYPFYFQKINALNWSSGSPSLGLMKKLGYRIDLFSSVRLNYYDMDHLLFGENRYLLDRIYQFPVGDGNSSCKSDVQTIEALLKRMDEKRSGGGCFLTFLESTHFDYSWENVDKEFSPFSKNINYLTIAFSKKNLEKVKNRYRNAVRYIDSLFGRFLDQIRATGREDAIIIISGDHGEEFYENGHLFHASNLNNPQTRVPIYFKYGNSGKLETPAFMSSHLDIFPSIFHLLLKEDYSKARGLFEGQSIFAHGRWPYIISARYNAGRPPFEFCLHDGNYKLLLQFENKRNIFDCNILRVIGIHDSQDTALKVEESLYMPQFLNAFPRLFGEQ